jgi:hypothetical protein
VVEFPITVKLFRDDVRRTNRRSQSVMRIKKSSGFTTRAINGLVAVHSCGVKHIESADLLASGFTGRSLVVEVQGAGRCALAGLLRYRLGD